MTAEYIPELSQVDPARIRRGWQLIAAFVAGYVLWAITVNVLLELMSR